MANVVRRIVDCDRSAGFGIQPKPPISLLGKRVTIWRPLTDYNGYLVKYKGKRYLLLACEIEKCGYYGKKRLKHTDHIAIAGDCGPVCPLLSKTKVKNTKGAKR